MAKHQFSIFFSWQSDIKENKSIIRSGINNACNKLKQSNNYQFLVDEATRNLPGSPNIEESVKTKIEHCDVFVADITPIAQYGNKQLPNPNVLIELGYALRCIDVDRIIIVAKASDYQDKDLPFDINHQRIGKFDGEECNLDFEIAKSIKYVLDNGKFQYIRFFNDIHLQQNISIGKYLPDVFLEDSDFKEYLRCFVCPSVFYTKLFYEAEKLNFDYYNQEFELKGKPSFDFSIAPFHSSIKGLSFTDATKQIDAIIYYLKNKISELEQRRCNSSYFAKRKIEDITKGFEYCNKRICLITGKAGQGKTNMICDFVENVILKRNIPFVYLNGSDIDANNIGDTIVKSLYPEENYSLGDMLRYVQRFCHQQNKPLIIIIDGLNEHGHSTLLKANLQQIINTLMQLDFVKLLISCRTEYYDANYKDMLVTFKNYTIEHECNSYITKECSDTLIDNYCDYFKIKANFTSEIKQEFSNNLLLLRIYSETYKNQNVGLISHIRKDSLFQSYYSQMCKNIADSMRNTIINVNYSDIRFFYETLVKLMINKNTFSNIPINDVLSTLSESQKAIFYQFIDSNILIKRELSNNMFNNEVIGFTFDEFRDFMISHYLVDNIYDNNSPESFIKCVSMFTIENHILREGLTCFLFCYAKENKNNDVLDVLKRQVWYYETFIRYIWEINEDNVTDEDITLLKEMIIKFPIHIERLIFDGRLDTNRFKKLNVNLFVNILVQFSDDKLRQFLNHVWPENIVDMFSYPKRTPRELYIEAIDNSLKKSDLHKDEYWYKIFIPVLFLAPFSYEAQQLLKKYYLQNQSKLYPIFQNIKLETKSKKLKTFIENYYDI